MTELIRIAEGTAPARGSVIFVHGLGGDPQSTWQSKSGGEETFWPRWLAQDLKDLSVWTLGYTADPLGWTGSSMSLPDRAANIMAALLGRNLLTEPIVFVCHSLGGLVVKQLLRYAGDRPGQPEGMLLQATRGVVFIATPGAGSQVANWVDKLRALLKPTPAIRDLQPNDAYVRDLATWYRNHAPLEDIATLNFVEAERVAAVTIVNATSGNQGIPGAEVIPIDADHFAIAKPKSRDEVLYLRTRSFFEKVLPKPAAAPVVNDAAVGSQKIFISYRHTDVDSGLAELLEKRFREAGHEVFIDRKLKVGMDWVEEIEQRIAWCNVMVVLLSEEAVQSEMVQKEVQMAHERRRAEGRPNLLPVRVAFTGLLDYRLGAILDRLQYVLWQTAADDERVSAMLLEACRIGHTDLPVNLSATPSVLVDPTALLETTVPEVSRPQSAADPRILRRPDTMGAQLDDPCYMPREADHMLMDLADGTTGVITVIAAGQMGKTSLVLRYLARCQEHGKRTGYLDFNQFDDQEMNTSPAFLTAFARQILRECRLDPQLEKPIKSLDTMLAFMEDVVFTQCAGPIALCLDQVDRLVGRPSQKDVFSMLRSWVTRASSHPQFGWNRLELVLSASTEPLAFIDNDFESPFNLGEPIRLQVFDRPAVEDLTQKFKSNLSAKQLDKIHHLTGGHPFLLRWSLWRLFGRSSKLTIEELDRVAVDDDGPFSEHLRAKLSSLIRHSQLAPALSDLLARGIQPAPAIAHRLNALGLLKSKGPPYCVANSLYERYFNLVLK